MTQTNKEIGSRSVPHRQCQDFRAEEQPRPSSGTVLAHLAGWLGRKGGRVGEAGLSASRDKTCQPCETQRTQWSVFIPGGIRGKDLL